MTSQNVTLPFDLTKRKHKGKIVHKTHGDYAFVKNILRKYSQLLNLDSSIMSTKSKPRWERRGNNYVLIIQFYKSEFFRDFNTIMKFPSHYSQEDFFY